MSDELLRERKGKESFTKRKGTPMMKVVELIGEIDDKHQLQAQVPEALPPGPVRIIVLVPEEDEAGTAWMQGLAHEWAEELSDPREDIYTLEDGKPVDAAR